MEPGSPVLQVDSLPSEPPGKTLDCDSSRESSEKWIYLEIILYSQLIRLLECLRRCAGRKKGVKNFELTNQKVGVIINWCWKTTEDTRVLVNRKILHLSLQTLRDPWTVVHQAPLSMGFFRQEYWSALPFPSPGDLQPRDQHRSPVSPSLQADSLPTEPLRNPFLALGCSLHFLCLNPSSLLQYPHSIENIYGVLIICKTLF